MLIALGVAAGDLLLVRRWCLIFTKAFSGGWRMLLAKPQEDYMLNAIG